MARYTDDLQCNRSSVFVKGMLGDRMVLAGLSAGGLLLLGYLDYFTGFELEISLFYALPVAMIAWGVGRLAGTFAAAWATTVWFGANILFANPYSSTFYALWNTALRGGWFLTVALTISRIRADLDRERQLNATLNDTLAQVRELQGLLPICAWCKKIRNDEGYWEQLETYVRRHTRAQFTHGICPACVESQFPGQITDEK